jgi:hypothetical protein
VIDKQKGDDKSCKIGNVSFCRVRNVLLSMNVLISLGSSVVILGAVGFFFFFRQKRIYVNIGSIDFYLDFY